MKVSLCSCGSVCWHGSRGRDTWRIESHQLPWRLQKSKLISSLFLSGSYSWYVVSAYWAWLLTSSYNNSNYKLLKHLLPVKCVFLPSINLLKFYWERLIWDCTPVVLIITVWCDAAVTVPAGFDLLCLDELVIWLIFLSLVSRRSCLLTVTADSDFHCFYITILLI